MQQRRLGQQGPLVSSLGLGCMGMSDLYGAADRGEAIATVQTALERGVTLFDTGDFYGMGHNELLLGEALRGRRDQALISVKFGALRGPGGEWLGYDTRPAAIKNFVAYSLKRLGVDHIDIYRPARLDRQVPIEDTMGTLAELVQAGYIRHIGLSEVGAETLRRAAAVHPVCDLQIEYSLVSRGIEAEILPTCRDLGIGITAYGVLSRGLLSGHWRQPAGSGDFRAHSPRFQPGNVERNLALVEGLQQFAEHRGTTPARLAVAWVAAQGDDIVPLVGARRRDQLDESLGALAVTLSAADRAELERLLPPGAVAGDRYGEHQLRDLDSER